MTNPRLRTCRMYTVRLIKLLERLPQEILESVLRILPQKFYTRWLLSLPSTSILRKMGDFILGPNIYLLHTRKIHDDQESLVPFDKQALNTLRGAVACEAFIKNYNFPQQRVTLIANRSNKGLETLLETYKERLKQLKEVEVHLDGLDLTIDFMHALEVFRHNLTILSLDHVKFRCHDYIKAHGWNRFTNLATFVCNDYPLDLVSPKPLYLNTPASNESEQESGDTGQLLFPSHLIELSITYSQIKRFESPPKLQVLKLSTYTGGPFNLKMLPPTLTTLDLNIASHYKGNWSALLKLLPPTLRILRLSEFEGESFQLELLPHTLTTLALTVNTLCEITGTLPELLESVSLSGGLNLLERISSQGWPPRLRHLELDRHPYFSLFCVHDVLQCLRTLHILRCGIEGNPFPSFSCLVELEVYVLKILSELIEFPSTLQKLSLCEDNLTSLEVFDFPVLLETLDLSYNEIVDLDTFPAWERLVNLIELDLSYNRVHLGLWMPPSNLETLELDDNEIESLEGCSLFLPGNENLKLRYLGLACSPFVYTPSFKPTPPMLKRINLVGTFIPEDSPRLAEVKHLCQLYDPQVRFTDYYEESRFLMGYPIG